jgi:hypothetical protein
MRTCLVAVLTLAVVSACATTTGGAPRPVRLTPAWTTPGLANPESALLAASGDFLYVSNVAGEGEARDGNGFIARLALDGTVLEREWARGLDAPKGLARRGDTLYVADVAQLVAIDAATGAVRARHPLPGAVFLNDVALAPGGAVLVSDSGSARIFAVDGNAASVWLADPRLDAINGLLAEPDRLVVTTMAGKLLAVDWHTHAITVLADGLGNADGVVALDGGRYLVGEWPGRLFVVAPDGSSTTLLDTRAQKTYLNDFLIVGGRLVVPNWEPGSVTAYDIEH